MSDINAEQVYVVLKEPLKKFRVALIAGALSANPARHVRRQLQND